MKYKKVKTLIDIKNDPRVLTVDDLGDQCTGSNSNVDIWIRLKPGFQWDKSQTHNVHERSLKQACKEMNTNVQTWDNDPELK